MSNPQPFFVQIDLTEAETYNGISSAVPPGTYVFEITDAEQTVSNKNEPQIRVYLRVAEVVETTSTDDVVGRTMSKWISLKNERVPMARLKNFLVAIGAPLQGFGRDDLLGRQFQAMVQQRTLPAQTLPNGQPGEPKVITDVVGETPVGGSAAPAKAPAAQAPAANAAAAGRRVVGASAARNGAPVR